METIFSIFLLPFFLGVSSTAPADLPPLPDEPGLFIEEVETAPLITNEDPRAFDHNCFVGNKADFNFIEIKEGDKDTCKRNENGTFVTDKNRIYRGVFNSGSTYLTGYEIVQGDPTTLQVLSDSFFIIEKRVFFNSGDRYQFLTNVNARTAKPVSHHCIKDRKGVYCDVPYLSEEDNTEMKKVAEADTETFESIDEFEIYFKDKNSIFCDPGLVEFNLTPLVEADIESFTATGYAEAQDKDYIFNGCEANRL